MIEIETPEELRRHLDERGDLRDTALQGLDLADVASRLEGTPLGRTVFLGCTLPHALMERALSEGAVVFPPLPDRPFAAFRGQLYTAEELYAGFDPTRPESYDDTFDARVYRHWQRSGGARPDAVLESLARRLHDHAISDALDELLHPPDSAPPRVVAVMGGHAMGRDADEYRKVATIGRSLTRRGFFMATGGGPGAMEATNLGAWLAPQADPALDEALDVLAAAPHYRDPNWLARAYEVRSRFPLAQPDRARGASLGVPTWLYGHEPPNPFATHIAKYFANSIREEGLVSMATYGIVFAPGGPGTIQEIFQDACQNHYRSVGVVSPMILLGRDFWSETRPVRPLLRVLSEGRDYGRWIATTDEVAEVVDLIEHFAAVGLDQAES